MGIEDVVLKQPGELEEALDGESGLEIENALTFEGSWRRTKGIAVEGH